MSCHPNPNQSPPVGFATEYVNQRTEKENPPPNPLFDAAHVRFTKALEDNLTKIKAHLAAPHPDFDPGQGPFLPYLLIRWKTGDHGDRPLWVCPVGSPDIWIHQGDPATTPLIPSDRGPGTILLNTPYTLYAHVWNLGRAPAGGARVEFYWSDTGSFCDAPGAPGDGSAAHLLGIARVDLPGRTSPDCHKLVKCPVPLSFTSLPVYSSANILVRVSALGDPIVYPWNAIADRHMMYRRFTF
jgi:hypothetical protein